MEIYHRRNIINSTVERIKTDLRKLGVKENNNLLVHSSLRSLGEVPGGAELVVCALLEALGPHGNTAVFGTVLPGRQPRAAGI